MSEPSFDSTVDRRALYLRWRPRRFADVVGQDAVTRTLCNAVVRGTVAHGYLLCGPRGTGKTSIARILFKALNCENPHDGDPCGVCASCLRADSGQALDLIEIDAASNRGIDDVRALRERVRFAPAEARSKVYIVDEAHQLTAPAWDAFLKTLEEPPPNTVFVLATTAAHKVPATIVSRCQRFDLRRIPQTQIAAHLAVVAASEGIVLETDVAERLARLARGGLRDALSILEQVASFSTSPVTLEEARRVLGLVRGDALRAFVDALAQRDTRQALLVLEDIAQEGADLRQFVAELLVDLRSTLLIRAGAEAAVVAELTPEERTWLGEIARHWAPAELVTVLQLFGAVEAGAPDERQLLVRLELATARAAGLPAAVPPAPAVRLEPPSVPEASPAAVPQGSARPVDRPADPSVEHPVEPVAERSVAPPVAGLVERPAAPKLESSPPPSDEGEVAKLGTTLALPSLVVLRTRWLEAIAQWQGSLLVRMHLNKVAPIRVDDGVVTLAGPLDPVEAQRLDTQYRPPIEELYGRVLGSPVRLRFTTGDGDAIAPDSAEAADAPDAALSIAEQANALFGGQLIALAEES